MQLDQRARDGEPKPAALMALGELVLDLLEGPAELTISASGMPMPVSLMAMRTRPRRPRQMHVDAAAVAGEFDGIGQEIEEHLLQRAAVGFDHEAARGRGAIE